MRKFEDENKSKLVTLYCNCCGKKMKVENGIIHEGAFHVELSWGYFSNKDGEVHQFDLCEECYDNVIKNFKIPVGTMEMMEYL